VTLLFHSGSSLVYGDPIIGTPLLFHGGVALVYGTPVYGTARTITLSTAQEVEYAEPAVMLGGVPVGTAAEVEVVDFIPPAHRVSLVAASETESGISLSGYSSIVASLAREIEHAARLRVMLGGKRIIGTLSATEVEDALTLAGQPAGSATTVQAATASESESAGSTVVVGAWLPRRASSGIWIRR